ncbi:MAG TPA: hypothetical protein VFB77_14655 [Acidimicrobiales bacterium]|nr:hypothetical protein [Acidimicrobiales bacterium]
MLDLTPAPPTPDARTALDAVLGVAAGTLGLDRWRVHRARRRRVEALASVQRAADAVGSLRGSWRWGDFHLDERSRTSCSDVDLFGPEAYAADRLRTASGSLRVAVHVVDYERTVSLRVSYAFALVNLAVARLERADDPYLLAKAQLMLARQDARERYADVAARLGDASGARLLAHKLGLDPGARGAGSGGWAPGVPVGDPPPPLAPVLEQLLVGRLHRTGLETLRRYVENGLPELDERHRRYVGDKVARLSRTVVGT